MLMEKIKHLAERGITAMNWQDLLGNAKRTWGEFLTVIKTRAPDDERIAAL